MKTWETKSGQTIIQVLSGRSNAFLLTSPEKNLLIDTGPKYMRNTLIKRLDNLEITHIDYLILTHSHFDHANNAAAIKEKFGAKVIIHTSEATNLITGKPVIPRGTNFITKIIIGIFAQPAKLLMKTIPCEPDILVEDYFELKELGFDWYIIHTPGHTPGSVCVIVDDEIALVGDTMFGVFKGSIFPPYAYNAKEMIASWGKLLETNCHKFFKGSVFPPYAYDAKEMMASRGKLLVTNCQLFLPSHGSAISMELLKKEYKKHILRV